MNGFSIRFSVLAICLFGSLSQIAFGHTYQQLRALSYLESRDNDKAKGKLGEVSRYQINPALWKKYSPNSNAFADFKTSTAVASRICNDLEKRFKQKTRKTPNNVEFFLLWNCPSHFAAVNYNVARVKETKRKLAYKFARLVKPSRAPAATAKAGRIGRI